MKTSYDHPLCIYVRIMSGGGRSLLLLLQQCVTGRQTRLLSGFQAGGSWLSHRCCHLIQQQTKTNLYRQRSFQPSPVLNWHHLGLCTKVSLSCCYILSCTDQRWHRLPFSVAKTARVYRHMLFFCRPELHGRMSTHPCQPTSQNQTRRRFTLFK